MEQRRQDDLRVVEERDALDRDEILDAQRVSHLEARDVELHMLRDTGRQSLDLHLARDLLHGAALLGAGRLASELHVHGRLDRAVEPHLVEVDVRERAANRVALEVLEDGVMGRRLALDHDVDDRVQARGARERRAEAPLVDDDRARVALAVEDTGNEPLLAEAAHAAGADLVGSALGDLESDAIARHRRTMVAEAARERAVAGGICEIDLTDERLRGSRASSHRRPRPP